MTSDAAFLAIVESLARLHPDLDRDDFRRGAGGQALGRDAVAVRAATPTTETTR